MSFGNSEDTVDHLDLVRYNFVGFQSINGFNDSPFISAEHNVRIDDELQQESQSNWLNSPSGSIDEPRDNDTGSVQGSVVGPHQVYTPVISYHDNRDRLHASSYDCAFMNSIRHDCQSTTYDGSLSTNEQILADHLQVFRCQQSSDLRSHHQPFVRVVKRRTTANKKERRRTQSINNAYADLRDCINVPADTKLSKIKTLRLALSYISYLTGILGANDDAMVASYHTECSAEPRRSSAPDSATHCSHGKSSPMKKGHLHEEQIAEEKPNESVMPQHRQPRGNSKAAKGRTGWPQHLWAMELKQQQSF